MSPTERNYNQSQLEPDNIKYFLKVYFDLRALSRQLGSTDNSETRYHPPIKKTHVKEIDIRRLVVCAREEIDIIRREIKITDLEKKANKREIDLQRSKLEEQSRKIQKYESGENEED